MKTSPIRRRPRSIAAQVSLRGGGPARTFRVERSVILIISATSDLITRSVSMRSRYIRIQNPAGGQILINQEYESTTVRCHWPASSESRDDWTDINLMLDSRDYLWAIRHLMEKGSGHIESI